jgi:hypothetical protein
LRLGDQTILPKDVCGQQVLCHQSLQRRLNSGDTICLLNVSLSISNAEAWDSVCLSQIVQGSFENWLVGFVASTTESEDVLLKSENVVQQLIQSVVCLRSYDDQRLGTQVLIHHSQS